MCTDPRTGRELGEKQEQLQGDLSAKTPESGQRVGCEQPLRSGGPTDLQDSDFTKARALRHSLKQSSRMSKGGIRCFFLDNDLVIFSLEGEQGLEIRASVSSDPTPSIL